MSLLMNYSRKKKSVTGQQILDGMEVNKRIKVVKMKIILIFCFVVIASCAHSQIPIGVKIGMTANDIDFRNDPGERAPYEYRMVTSYHAGLFSKIKLFEKVFLYPEIQYNKKYSSYTFVGKKEQIKLSYVEIPLLFSYQPIKWLAFEAGGSAGIVVRNETPFKFFDEIDAGAIGGLRFNVTKNFSVISRYYYGITSIGPYEYLGFYSYTTKGAKVYSQNLQFSLAYYFGK
jgi:hypothetical protein